MLESFLKYIQEERLFDSGQKILLAVSGGLDSMVMLHLFRKTGFHFSVAHCNFQLRGDESDGDEQFVRNYCDQHNIQLFVKQFDTTEYAQQEGISIEMAARDLRYEWFRELMQQHHFDRLATAHHQDDVLETFFINLARGTGIRGLSGIKAINGNIIRPILFADRLSLRNYAALYQIDCREDSTNSDTSIRRNFIRHRIIPMLDEFNASFRANLSKTVAHLEESEQLFDLKINEIRHAVISQSGTQEIIDIERLRHYPALRTVLFELLRDKNFSSEQIDGILASLTADSGKKFYSPTHRLIKDREELIVTEIKDSEQELFYIESDCKTIKHPISLHFEIIQNDSDFSLSKKQLVADFDFEKLEFPLILRRWNEGEYFQPLGMSGFKKLSDFFIDQKYSIPEKENTWILASGNKIVWIVGKRIDNRFKVTAETERVFRISLF